MHIANTSIFVVLNKGENQSNLKTRSYRKVSSNGKQKLLEYNLEIKRRRKC